MYIGTYVCEGVGRRGNIILCVRVLGPRGAYVCVWVHAGVTCTCGGNI